MRSVPFRVERAESPDPLMARWRYTCCGYEFGEPLCFSGYEPVAKRHCPRCGEKMADYGARDDAMREGGRHGRR